MLRKALILIIYLTLCANMFLVAQTPPELQYTPNLDSLWSQDTYIHKVSNDGKWTVFSEKFSDDKKLVWLMATHGKTKFKIPNSEYLEFAKNNKWFACINNKNELIRIDLNNLKEETYRDISFYNFSLDGNYIAMLRESIAQEKELIIINLETNKTEKISNVITFEWHPKQNFLFAILNREEGTQLIRYDTKTTKSKSIFKQPFGVLEHLEISSSGNSLIFVSNKKGLNQLSYYDIVQDSLSIISDTIIQRTFSGQFISNRKPHLAADGKKVVFYTQITQYEIKKTHDVQIWNSDDPWIEPRMEEYRDQETNFQLTVWFPHSGQISAIETPDHPTAVLDVNNNIALVYNQIQYEPLYKISPNADIFVKNLITGGNILACKNQYTEGEFLTISPSGKNIAYFKDSHWWIYNIASGENTNLTKDIPFSFAHTELQVPGDIYPYGNPGWFSEDENLILYDQFDVWLLSPDGNIKKRITKGREEKIRYRINEDHSSIQYNPLTVNQKFSCFGFNLNKGIILELFDIKTNKTGLAFWYENSKIKPLLWSEGKIDQVRMSVNDHMLVYRKQRFNKPISIHSFDIAKKKKNLLYQTNEKLLDYDLGKGEIIEYVLDDGTKLKGSLLYPSNYSSSKKYPLIVKIYEMESYRINNFDPPSTLMRDGFNALKFITNGYFVFYPDISYNIGDPGISALRSVKRGVAQILESKNIDDKKMGLIGHSFGGYETAFIVTQTDMFSAAVAGAAITDLVTYYHDVAWDYKLIQMSRMENQQLRMGDSFYNMKDSYYQNSPLAHVEKVTTPLLLWTGKKDTNVNWPQSVYMHMALKRLGKKAKLLLYENEDHILFKPQNQNHLSLSIFNWMETYVK